MKSLRVRFYYFKISFHFMAKVNLPSRLGDYLYDRWVLVEGEVKISDRGMCVLHKLPFGSACEVCRC